VDAPCEETVSFQTKVSAENMLISIFIVMCGKTGKGFNYSMKKWLDILKRISVPTIRIVKY